MLDGDFLLLTWRCVLLNKYLHNESIYLVNHFLLMLYLYSCL